MKIRYSWNKRDDQEDKNNGQKDLDHQRPVRRQVPVIAKQLILGFIDVHFDIIRVALNSLDSIPLLSHHLSQLLKDSTKFLQSGLDRLNGCWSVLDVL